jgi:hypothetical protein
MNFKNFKKVHEDDDKAILKNEMGHSITIAKKSLSKEHAKGLKDLPLYQADPDSEVGGADNAPEPGDNDVPMTPEQESARVKDVSDRRKRDIAGGEEAQTPIPGLQPQPQQAPQQDDQSQQPQMPQPQAQTMVQDAQQQTQGYAPVNATQQQAQQYQQEAMAYAQDIASGHITPETYHSLFAKKDTLGKIGTLFGLLVGGAGAGLTHGQNPVLSMMDKQIANDLDAQKTSKANAQNFLKLNQQNELLKTQIPNLVATGKLTGAQTQQALAAAKIDADTHTMMQMKISALNYAMQLANKYPPGSPQAAAAGQTVQALSQGVQQSIAQISQTAAEQKAALEQQFGATQQFNIMAGMSEIAANNYSRHVPGFGTASKPVPESTINELKSRLDYEKAAQEYVQFAHDHQGNWSSLSPEKRLEVESRGNDMGRILQQKYLAAHPGYGTSGERDQLNKMIPPTPVSFLARFSQIPKVQETIHSNRMSADNTADMAGLPERPWQSDEPNAPKQKAAAPAVVKQETRWYNGKEYRRGPGGKSIPVQ